MRKIIHFTCLALLLSSNAYALQLTSSSIQGNKNISEQYTSADFGCTGQDISPQLSWNDAPEGTKSFALTMYDADAKSDENQWHWIVFNIPTNINTIPEGMKPQDWPASTIHGETKVSEKGFGGICPPKGERRHRYIFKVHALDTVLTLTSKAAPTTIEFFIKKHQIAEGSIRTFYGRPAEEVISTETIIAPNDINIETEDLESAEIKDEEISLNHTSPE